MVAGCRLTIEAAGTLRGAPRLEHDETGKEKYRIGNSSIKFAATARITPGINSNIIMILIASIIGHYRHRPHHWPVIRCSRRCRWNVGRGLGSRQTRSACVHLSIKVASSYKMGPEGQSQHLDSLNSKSMSGVVLALLTPWGQTSASHHCLRMPWTPLPRELKVHREGWAQSVNISHLSKLLFP